MKSVILSLLALPVLVSASAIAQDNVAPVASVKPLVVSGRVSNDGKMLLTDLDSAWNITNREALKGLEGLLVRVKCFVNTEKNSLQILSVKKDGSETNYSAVRYSDSAFRR
jgi:hypothetical protein